MDLKITFDVTPALADVAKCLCRALELRSANAHAFHCAAAHVEPQKADAHAKVENSPVEAPEPVDVPKPAPTPENAAGVKPEAVPEPVQVEQAAEPQAEQSTEPQAEQSTEPEPEPAPVEAPKAKRSHRKKAAPEPALSPEPVQVAEPEPQPEPEPQVEPAPAEPAPAEPATAEPVLADTPNAPTIDDVRAVGVKLGAAGKQSVIIDYLKAHGCKSLSQLDPGCYAALIEIGKAAL